jgi:hypothetical protein
VVSETHAGVICDTITSIQVTREARKRVRSNTKTLTEQFEGTASRHATRREADIRGLRSIPAR